ncbi:MAG: hypothetical protein Q8R47_06370 [Nanoarchaeota archaeon]|nr:hypothetical protein [Nanoarchaeota archaeon]
MRKAVFVALGLLAVSLVVLNLDGKITGKAVSPYTCTDSDGGRNPTVQGTVKNALGSYTDTCKDARTVYENFCKGNVQRKETVPCRFGCKDGACVSS